MHAILLVLSLVLVAAACSKADPAPPAGAPSSTAPVQKAELPAAGVPSPTVAPTPALSANADAARD